MAIVSAYVPAETASVIYSRVDAIARTLRASGEKRNLEQLRQIMNDPNSVWRPVFTDPASGAVRDIGRTSRRPQAALAELIRVRDRECRMPACHRPAHHGDIDHARPWRSGGATSRSNLHCLCRRHNLLKEKPGWRFHHNPGTGELAVTTPARRIHRTQPEAPTSVGKTDGHPEKSA